MAINKTRIAQLEKTARTSRAGNLIHVTERDGRYFDTTPTGGFNYDNVIASLCFDADELAAAGYREMTKAEVDALGTRGLLTVIFDYSKLIQAAR